MNEAVLVHPELTHSAAVSFSSRKFLVASSMAFFSASSLADRASSSYIWGGARKLGDYNILTVTGFRTGDLSMDVGNT